MAIGLFIAFALGAAFGYIMCAVLSANMTDEEWQKICGVPIQPTTATDDDDFCSHAERKEVTE